MQKEKRRFPTGQLICSRRVNLTIQKDSTFAAFVTLSLRKHKECDWGDCCSEDAALNDAALNNGTRIFSVYNYKNEEVGDGKIWIITEADRVATTVLFPSEY